MKRSVYNRVVEEIDRMEFDFRPCVRRLVELFPEEDEAVLRSVAAQQWQKQIKKMSGRMKSPHQRAKVFEEFLKARDEDKERVGANSAICDLAKKLRFSPLLLCRITLEEFLESNNIHATRQEISEYMRCPSKIPDRFLATEVYFCRMRDDQYGHYSEAIKYWTGEDHETKIKVKCQELGLSYRDEYALRAQGYDKTPDILLDVPIAVNGRAVNWIESKALFGDDNAHTSYLRDQLESYWNRFGPGLVIYWFGFIDDLASKKYGGIMLADRFPDDFVRYDPEHGNDNSDADWGIDGEMPEDYNEYLKGVRAKEGIYDAEKAMSDLELKQQ